MPETPLTLAAIQAMDAETLNLALDQHCTTHAWTRVSLPSPRGHPLWELHDDPDLGRVWSSVPHLHYTASWDRTMALRQTHGQGIDVVWTGATQVVRTRDGDRPAIACTTEEEVRRAICELVLWQTGAREAGVARQEAPHGPST